jgi:AcrR family transcriptional regulator
MVHGPLIEPEAGLRERHKRRRRGAILQAVRDLLRDDPERELSKERIAERAEVAPATVYNLVGTRARLWEALAEDFMDELEGRLVQHRDRDPVARVRQVVGHTVTLFVEDPVVSARMLRGWEESGLVLRRGPITHLAAALRAGQDAGVLVHKVDVQLLASSIASGCIGALHQWAARLIDDRKFRARALLAADVALAAAATDAHRARLLRALRRRRDRGAA